MKSMSDVVLALCETLNNMSSKYHALATPSDHSCHWLPLTHLLRLQVKIGVQIILCLNLAFLFHFTVTSFVEDLPEFLKRRDGYTRSSQPKQRPKDYVVRDYYGGEYSAVSISMFTGFSSQERAKLHVFHETIVWKCTHLSPSLTRKTR